METITNNEFLNSILETEAWKRISQREILSVDMIEKFAENLDWKEVSGNGNVLWTVEGVNRFASKIQWDEFSRNCPDNFISEFTLQKFSSKWDWKVLSNRDLIYNNWKLLDKFANKIVWSEVVTNYNIEKPIEFFIHFQQYLPDTVIRDSRLWHDMVESRAQNILQKAIGIE